MFQKCPLVFLFFNFFKFSNQLKVGYLRIWYFLLILCYVLLHLEVAHSNNQRPVIRICLWKYSIVPVDARALYTQGDAQVDAGPAGLRLPTVAAANIAWDGQDFLQGTLSFQWSLLWLPSRVQAPCWCGRLPVQLLTGKKQGRRTDKNKGQSRRIKTSK